MILYHKAGRGTITAKERIIRFQSEFETPPFPRWGYHVLKSRNKALRPIRPYNVGGTSNL